MHVALRQPCRAGSFYPVDAAGCVRALDALRQKAPALPPEVLGAYIKGGLVPHAGWVYSGATALSVFQSLAQSQPRPETVLIFATAHRSDVQVPCLQSEGAWRVPTGDVEIDAPLAALLLKEAGGPKFLEDRAQAHAGDHAIEVQLPLLTQLLPGVRFVPVAVPRVDFGPKLGEAAARAAQQLGRKVAALASSDLTHYGPNYYDFAPKGTGLDAHRWSKEVNDRGFLERVLALDAAGACAQALEHQSACGPAATAAALACAKTLGATHGVLLEHTTSWERAKQDEGAPCDFVGYAGVVFL